MPTIVTQAPQQTLIVRLADCASDLLAVQRLRARVFFTEFGAAGGGITDPLDSDIYDPLCDHLLVIDRANRDEERVVGTYRLLREAVARSSFGFYSAHEFDISAISQGPHRPQGELLELGRSCVLPAYRNSGTIALLWRGIADYIARHNIGMMFGCASFLGTDPDAIAVPLSYLAHHHLAPLAQRPKVHGDKGIALERLPRDAYEPRRAMLQLPPLIKGYLRAGALFGDGAYIDHTFNTIDVCVVLATEAISARYASRFCTAA